MNQSIAMLHQTIGEPLARARAAFSAAFRSQQTRLQDVMSEHFNRTFIRVMSHCM
jgi:hypothetical protein